MGKERWGIRLAGLAVFALVVAACGGDDGGTDASVEEGLTGSISISGSSTVEPISALVAELFNDPNPDVRITVQGPGTGDGFELFCQGEIAIADASRRIDEEEVAACEAGGISYQELEVALDGIAVVVNAESPIECLTPADLYAIFGPASDGIDSAADANALSQEVGGAGDIPDQDLEVTAPGEESGTYDAFIELSGIPDLAVENGVAEDASEALRGDYTSSPNDNVIIQAMEGSPNAIGFVGFAFAEEAGDAVKEVAIDAGGGCVAPTAETIADGTYPLSRSLYIYPNTDMATDDDALKAFVDYYLTEDGLVAAVEEAGYIVLPTERQDATASAWASAVS
ncbi:MAG TPA: phosphate ABC transporter substrate-binding protein PstS family protein [Actinomycetota bacterium]|nr:phosphate ABC transporter substrate-binding protein PstS family protein [Actinomycetota bacterium]